MPSDIVVRLQTLDQGWQALGVDRYKSITPESLRCSANLWGPDACGFTLKRKPGAIFPDLLSPTPCEIDIAGVTCWDGWLKEAPESDSGDFQIGVVGAGWQYHLDEDTNDKVWAHTRLPDWQDSRTFVGADLTKLTQKGSIANDRGMVMLGFPAGVALALNQCIGVTLDLGAGGNWAKRVVVSYNSSNNNANMKLYCRSSSSATPPAGTDVFAAFANNAGASGTQAGTITTASRYLHIFFNCDVASTPAADTWFQLTAVQVFSATAYESGNASILKTSDLVKDVLPWAPLLSQDTSLIAATTFNWPEAAPFDDKTPREIIEGFNAAEAMQPRLRVGKQLEYRAFPTAPLFEIGEWSGAEFHDTAAGSAQDVYNKCIVRGTGPDGTKIRVVRTQTGTVHDRFGRTHTMVLPVSIGLNTTLANKLGDTFNGSHKTTPFKGDFTAWPGGVRNVQGGTMHPGHLLLHPGELTRLSHRIDPDTGGWGRDGRIVQIAYDGDADNAQISLDNFRDNFNALLQRLGAVVGGG